MKSAKFAPKSALIFVLAAAATLLPAYSLADTYEIFNLGTDLNSVFYGMNDSGLVVIDRSDHGFCGTTPCWYSYVNGLGAGAFTLPPVIASDNGTQCTPSVPAGGLVLFGVCNNGRDAFTGFLTSKQISPGVYTDPAFDPLIPSGGGGRIYMNALGDIVFDDTYSQNWLEALDLTTLPSAAPEPASLPLLATGLLTFAIPAIRRRASFAKE